MNRVSVHLADRPPTLVPCRIADGWAAFEAAAFGALGLDARTRQLAELWLCTRDGVAEALLPRHLLRDALRDMDHVLLRLAAREASPKAAPPPAEASARAAPRKTAAAPPATPASGADMPPPPPPAARAATQRDDMSRHVTVWQGPATTRQRARRFPSFPPPSLTFRPAEQPWSRRGGICATFAPPRAAPGATPRLPLMSRAEPMRGCAAPSRAPQHRSAALARQCARARSCGALRVQAARAGRRRTRAPTGGAAVCAAAQDPGDWSLSPEFFGTQARTPACSNRPECAA